MAKEEPEEDGVYNALDLMKAADKALAQSSSVDVLYVLIETGQLLKVGDEVFQDSGNRWQTMSPTVDGIKLVPGLKVRRKVTIATGRPRYIFLEPNDICQDGDELYFTNTTGDFWRPVFYHMIGQRAQRVFMVRRKVL